MTVWLAPETDSFGATTGLATEASSQRSLPISMVIHDLRHGDCIDGCTLAQAIHYGTWLRRLGRNGSRRARAGGYLFTRVL